MVLAYIYQLAKFGDLMSCGSKDIFENVKTTTMQNDERQERYREWLRGKGKSTKHYKVQCDVQARTGTKRCSAKIG